MVDEHERYHQSSDFADHTIAMGYDYALVHLFYTIPPAILLTLLYRPFLSRLDLYKIGFLITVAVTATIPWDSYLVRNRIWTYPETVILGPTLFSIPAEEVFFFFIQTYNTTLLYLLLSKAAFHPSHLGNADGQHHILRKYGSTFLTLCVLAGFVMVYRGGEGTYMGLILAWAAPVALFQWVLCADFLVSLPLTNSLIPIALPTLYLWIVDTLALRRGTWSIETGTKFGIHLWDGLEIEEAVFFLATNTLIVLGLVAFDNALVIFLTFPHLFPEAPELPSPALLLRALLTSPSKYEWDRVGGLKQAVKRLKKKSRSFYLASSTFSGRLRIDLVLLYSFCRVADDLIDNATKQSEAQEWIKKLSHFLDLSYASKETKVTIREMNTYISDNFPESMQSALLLLPTGILPYGPLYDLLEGFRTDLEYTQNPPRFPISNEHDLETYAARVAGTVAELCLGLVFHHTHTPYSTATQDDLIHAGGRMGIALQYVNIARDIARDAAIGRVYLPTSWLKAHSLTPQDVIKHPGSAKVEELREQLLDKAFADYQDAHSALARLPVDARAPMRVAIESYMEIGRVLQEKGYQVKDGKATVPKLRRIRVAWNALSQG